MTTCREVIADAYAELGVSNLSAKDAAYGLRRFNALLDDLAGMGVGERLKDLDLSRHPAWATRPPLNARLLVPAGVKTISFPCDPQNGSRLAVVDVDSAFATSPVTLFHGERRAEGAAADLVLNEAGMSRTWMYREDTANWARVTALEIGDDFPLIEECRDAFVTLLAVRLQPATGLPVPDATTAASPGAKARLKARHRQTIIARAPRPVLCMGRQAFNRGEVF